MDSQEIFELTAKQEKAFNNLKKAIKDCINANLLFYNNYGTLGVCDNNKVSEYNDKESDYADNLNCSNPNEVKLPCNEWADDSHYFHLNKKFKP